MRSHNLGAVLVIPCQIQIMCRADDLTFAVAGASGAGAQAAEDVGAIRVAPAAAKLSVFQGTVNSCATPMPLCKVGTRSIEHKDLTACWTA